MSDLIKRFKFKQALNLCKSALNSKTTQKVTAFMADVYINCSSLYKTFN